MYKSPRQKNLINIIKRLVVLMLVLFFPLSGVIGPACERREIRKQWEYAKQYMDSIPVEEQGYSISVYNGDIDVTNFSTSVDIVYRGRELEIFSDTFSGHEIREGEKRTVINTQYILKNNDVYDDICKMWYVRNGLDYSKIYDNTRFDAGVCKVFYYENEIYVLTGAKVVSPLIHREIEYCIPMCLFRYDYDTQEFFYLAYCEKFDFYHNNYHDYYVSFPKEK
ncbi:MAG: hypothetical protein II988_00080 [Clostridia bacterium]|nr:hypothetical protein [Clostridia bacterium]